MNKFFIALGAILATIIVLIIKVALSIAIFELLTFGICFCLGWAWNWLVGVGVYLIFLLIKIIYNNISNKVNITCNI